MNVGIGMNRATQLCETEFGRRRKNPASMTMHGAVPGMISAIDRGGGKTTEAWFASYISASYRTPVKRVIFMNDSTIGKAVLFRCIHAAHAWLLGS